MTATLKLSSLWKSNKTTLNTKLRVFDACVRSAFLYNSELWTLTRKTENKIDSFHRRILRKVLNVKWPIIIKNDDVYEKTKQKPWTQVISKQRLKWFGHVLRLPENAPVRVAFEEAERYVQRPQGRPLCAWLSCVKRQLSNLNIPWREAKTIARDRKRWKNFCNFCI